jgi:trimethylamine--corrinoid protein Co-methyltransferase
MSTERARAIDAAARRLLEDPGVMLEDEEVVSRCLAAGARPGSRPLVVRLPSQMIDDCLARAPREARFADRKGGLHAATAGSPPCFWTGPALFYLDSQGFRTIRQQDLADFVRVIDRLDEVCAVVGTSTEETPPGQRDFVGLRLMAQNTRKHLRALSFTAWGGEAMIEMGRVLAGSRTLKQAPVFSIGFTAHGPLRWTALSLGVFKSTAGYGIPVTVNGEPMAGASAPVTIAGAAAVGTAEILAGIVVNQLLEPGRPCLFNLGFAHVMDMRQGFAVTGGPENVLLAVAGAELARFYGLPSVSWMCTDSLGCDAQNALEKTLAAVTHAMAGVSVIWGVGQVESEKTISPVQAAIDNEIIALTRRVLRGFSVDETHLAVEEVRRVGICGSFLDSEHTLAHFREEVLLPELLVRTPRDTGGGTAGRGAGAAAAMDMVAQAEDKVRTVLAAPPEPQLAPEQERELLAIERRFADAGG